MALRLLIAAVTLLIAVPTAMAAGIHARSAAVSLHEEGYRLDAEFDIALSAGLEQAVNRGVAMYFVVEFELTKPRWYWFDERPIQLSQTYRLSYTPLLRQYRISSGNAYQNFTRFEDVMHALSRVRGWVIGERNSMTRGVAYQAAIRMRLDTAQLPKPFQLNAVASRDWNLESDWYRWTVHP